jgi:AcrR family transcriptional regulator
MTDPAPLGRRERKKAATRKSISDTATLLFLQRGYDNVSIREVADAADVSPTTVFAHFPQKEALVFDEDDEQRDNLVRVVRERPAGRSIHDSLRAFYEREIRVNAAEHGEGSREFVRLLDDTPALRDYAAKMWLRHEEALAHAIAEELGQGAADPRIRAYARFVLQLQPFINDSDDPLASVAAGFDVLGAGWASIEERLDEERSPRP